MLFTSWISALSKTRGKSYDTNEGTGSLDHSEVPYPLLFLQENIVSHWKFCIFSPKKSWVIEYLKGSGIPLECFQEVWSKFTSIYLMMKENLAPRLNTNINKTDKSCPSYKPLFTQNVKQEVQISEVA